MKRIAFAVAALAASGAVLAQQQITLRGITPWTADYEGFQQVVLGIAVVFTVVSGLQILRDGYRVQAQSDSRAV